LEKAICGFREDISRRLTILLEDICGYREAISRRH